VRYFLLSQHYRSPLDFSDDKLQQAKNALDGLDEAYQKLSSVPLPVMHPGPLEDLESAIMPDVLERFIQALNEDFNTEKALAVLHEFKKSILANLHTAPPHVLQRETVTFASLMQDYLGIPVLRQESIPEEVLQLKAEREKARKEKDWGRSDELRARLGTLGYAVEDNPGGTSTLIKKSIA
jgi:cysteinyl-tRNA synthetase